MTAGQTPSPEVIANAGAVEGLRVPVAVVCLVAVIVGLTVFSVVRQRHDIINQIPMKTSPQVLAAKARDIANRSVTPNHHSTLRSAGNMTPSICATWLSTRMTPFAGTAS
jgi:hypothetical protein